MDCIRYSERELFKLAFQNSNNVELLEILIKDFGLDVNWRSRDFFDTILYQSLKGSDTKAAEFLISKGACINASLGGYPRNNTDHGYMSILDAASGFYSLQTVGGGQWLRDRGAISYEKIPTDKKQAIIKVLDKTRVADNEKYITRAYDQARLSISQCPEEAYDILDNFVRNCQIVTVDIPQGIRK